MPNNQGRTGQATLATVLSLVISGAGHAQSDTVLAEDFESGTLDAWHDRGRPQSHRVVTGVVGDRGAVHSGRMALEVTFPRGADGGWLTRFFMPGFDSIYASYWVRFQPGWRSGTKLIGFFGSRTDDQWSAAGKAGYCPNGTDFFSAAVVQERNGNPGPTHFYLYYPGMPREPNGIVCYGSSGLRERPGARYTPPLALSTGRWHRIEFVVRLNDPGRNNFLQRFCVDGRQRGEWSGISVRADTMLRLNAFILTNSISGGSPTTQRMWVDDIVVLRKPPEGSCASRQ